MRFLICYDVVNDKVRAKIVKILENYGIRIQFSVFEFNLEKAQIIKMKGELKKKNLLNIKEMSFSIYPICENCYNKVERHGKGKITFIQQGKDIVL